MKLKEVILAAMIIAALIAQNYLLYSFPITLTYLFLYLIARKTGRLSLSLLSVAVFVTVKNIIYMAMPQTIAADFIGLSFFMFISKIKISKARYFIIPFVIILHIAIMDLSMAVIPGAGLEIVIAGLLTGGFITYIYAPMSIIFIVFIDGVDYITEY